MGTTMQMLKIEVGEQLGWKKGKNNLPGCGKYQPQQGLTCMRGINCIDY